LFEKPSGYDLVIASWDGGWERRLAQQKIVLSTPIPTSIILAKWKTAKIKSDSTK
jgi:hypothetical protein